MMAVEEYLNTSFHPDCDFIDGELIGRNVGKRKAQLCSGPDHNLVRACRPTAAAADGTPPPGSHRAGCEFGCCCR